MSDDAVNIENIENLETNFNIEILKEIKERRKRDWNNFFDRLQNSKSSEDIPVSSIGYNYVHYCNAISTKKGKIKQKTSLKTFNKRNKKNIRIGKIWRLMYRIYSRKLKEISEENTKKLEIKVGKYLNNETNESQKRSKNDDKENKSKSSKINEELVRVHRKFETLCSEVNSQKTNEEEIKKYNKVKSKILPTKVRTNLNEEKVDETNEIQEKFSKYDKENKRTLPKINKKLQEKLEIVNSNEQIPQIESNKKLNIKNIHTRKRKNYEEFTDVDTNIKKRKIIKLNNLLNNTLSTHEINDNHTYKIQKLTINSENVDKQILHGENVILLNVADFLNDSLF